MFTVLNCVGFFSTGSTLRDQFASSINGGPKFRRWFFLETPLTNPMPILYCFLVQCLVFSFLCTSVESFSTMTAQTISGHWKRRKTLPTAFHPFCCGDVLHFRLSSLHPEAFSFSASTAKFEIICGHFFASFAFRHIVQIKRLVIDRLLLFFIEILIVDILLYCKKVSCSAKFGWFLEQVEGACGQKSAYQRSYDVDPDVAHTVVFQYWQGDANGWVQGSARDSSNCLCASY